MRRRLHRFGLAAIAIVMLAGGCTLTQAGSPVSPPASAPETTTPGPHNRYGAPAVTNPLDAAKFLAQPCTALSTSQLASLNLGAEGEADTTSAVARNAGPSCSWKNSSIAYYVHLTFMTGNKNGLADFYRAHRDGDFQAYWIETTVDGYPGVFKDVRDSRPTGSCDLAVGVSDVLTFRTNVQSREGEKSCDQAKQAASLVLQTLKAGG
ncbi:DUF3558 domain-containing protein [Kibdelosporangium aridum]|uniref:DUF3558 domain-containing protein n=1 Tax=Kibdelosporangium aridum TaxID=2030 RepID=A0A1Y5XTI0_KIBAR|nr:DUF3558 domain-containing protein [Kibdelosporangium aridum]SMD16367.1 Protein of unknown function [Kibdelosporangium aridum]